MICASCEREADGHAHGNELLAHGHGNELLGEDEEFLGNAHTQGLFRGPKYTIIYTNKTPV